MYDLIVPEKNLLRKINDLIDFSFIYDELLNKYCANNGRMAESPIRMFQYLLLKTIYTVSDVDVVERCQYDMSFKYFLDMNLEDDVINPSSLTKFRKLRLKDIALLNLLINKTVVIAIEKGIIRSKSIIVDDQFKQRMPGKNTDNDLEKELAYCKELKERIENESSISSIPAVKEKLNLLKETVEDTQENLTLSKDTDAKIGHKSAESSFFGYKTHLAMTEERIITAALLTSGEKGDGSELPKLLEISQKKWNRCRCHYWRCCLFWKRKP